MNDDRFDVEVNATRARLDWLSQRASDPDAPHRAMAREIVKAFAVSVEELQAVGVNRNG